MKSKTIEEATSGKDFPKKLIMFKYFSDFSNCSFYVLFSILRQMLIAVSLHFCHMDNDHSSFGDSTHSDFINIHS